jgi:hypothetical protein
VNKGTIGPIKIDSSYMKTLSVIIAAFFLVFGVAVSRAAVDTTGGTHVLTRISNETGVPVDTLQAQKSATGLGYGELETANLLAKASGQSFDDIVARHQAGEGWGKIAHDNGLNLGKIVSAAHRSDKATSHAQNNRPRNSVHGKSSTAPGNGHARAPRGVGRGANGKSGQGAVHGARGKRHGHDGP